MSVFDFATHVAGIVSIYTIVFQLLQLLHDVFYLYLPLYNLHTTHHVSRLTNAQKKCHYIEEEVATFVFDKLCNSNSDGSAPVKTEQRVSGQHTSPAIPP